MTTSFKQWLVKGCMLAVSVVVMVGVLAHPGAAQCPRFWQEITASDLEARAFGASVDVCGPVAVVGAPGTIYPGAFSGWAYVSRETHGVWSEEQRLVAGDVMAGDNFAYSVAVSDNLAVVGAPLSEVAGVGSGAAYVFRFDGTDWVEEHKLSAADGAAGHRFGYAVAADGARVVVGALDDDHAGRATGSAYVFRLDGTDWIQEAKLTASDASAEDWFGYCVAIDADQIVVGAVGLDFFTKPGAAYVYRRGPAGWDEAQKLTASDGRPFHFFGYSVAIEDDTVLVGAIGDSEASVSAGAVYVFGQRRGLWTEDHKLLASDATRDAWFGHSVAVSGYQAAIGAATANSAYIFRFDGIEWTEDHRLTSGAGLWNRFGNWVAISGQTVAVGEPGGLFSDLPGKVHLFRGSGLHLDVRPRQAHAGGRLRFMISGGAPGELVLLRLVVMDGLPNPAASGIRQLPPGRSLGDAGLHSTRLRRPLGDPGVPGHCALRPAGRGQPGDR